MTASKNALLLLICLFLSGFALSCATGRPPTPVGPLVINPAALPAAVINVPYSATLTAVGGKQPFVWAMASGTLPPGLTISTSGANGVISGTPTTLGTTSFKVQVTDSQTPTAAVDIASESITVNPTLSISTTSLTAGSVGVPYGATLAAVGGVSPYTWSLTSGSLPAGLTLSTSGFITGTPTAQGTQSFTVQVSDSATPASTASASLSLTITGPTGRLNGNYVFSFSGFQNGNRVVQAGSFTADGQGNITAALMDSNSAAGVQTKLAFTGTYSLDTTNTGPMTLVIPVLGTFTYQLAVPAIGTIRFIQNGAAGNQGTGVIAKVASTTKVTVAQLVGFWAFGANGADAALQRYATAGTFQSSNTGAWTNGLQDTNDNGVVAASQAFTGSFVAIDPITGRGTATLTANSVTTNYSFYAASAGQLVMVGVDPLSSTAPLALFDLDTTTNTWSNSMLSITTVLQLQGVGTSNSNTVPSGLLAFVTFDGNGNIKVTTDQNLGGTLSTNTYTGTYSVASNGRTTLTGFGTNSVVFYLSNAIGFTLEGDSGVTTGTLVPQFATSPTNASFSGLYMGATLQTVLPSVTVEADSATSDGNGNLALFYDISGPGGPQQGLMQALTYSVDSTGRAPLVLNGTTVGIAYIVDAAGNTAGANPRVLVMSADANAKINALEQ
ncbi:MAG: putative Ig domain-containing protein [Candidatus Korobacteraceae bacterium]